MMIIIGLTITFFSVVALFIYMRNEFKKRDEEWSGEFIATANALSITSKRIDNADKRIIDRFDDALNVITSAKERVEYLNDKNIENLSDIKGVIREFNLQSRERDQGLTLAQTALKKEIFRLQNPLSPNMTFKDSDGKFKLMSTVDGYSFKRNDKSEATTADEIYALWYNGEIERI